MRKITNSVKHSQVMQKYTSHTLGRSRDTAITWTNRPYSRSPASMQWYHDKRPFPWHLKIVTQFAYPVRRVTSHTSSSNMPMPPWGCLGQPLSCIGTTVLPGCSVSSFSERSFADNWPLTSVPLQDTTPLMPHNDHLARVLSSQQDKVIKTQDWVPPDWTQNVDSHSAANGQVVRHLPKVKWLPL